MTSDYQHEYNVLLSEYNEVDDELSGFLKENPEFEQYAEELEAKYSQIQWVEESNQSKPIEDTNRQPLVQEEDDPYLYYHSEHDY